MMKIVGVIEKGTDGGYSIYADGGLPLFSHGMTETEARDSFESLVPEQAEYMKECTGEYPDWYDEDVAFESSVYREKTRKQNFSYFSSFLFIFPYFTTVLTTTYKSKIDKTTVPT